MQMPTGYRGHYCSAMDDQPPLLRDVHPDFSAELISLLNADGHADLAICAWDLRIVASCPCVDDFCQSFYTAPRPEGGYGPGHSNLLLDPKDGMIILDVVHNRIMFVEVLYHPPLVDQRTAVLAANSLDSARPQDDSLRHATG